ncbi:MAG: glycerate kinase [Tabrizicola sp.]|uniref:glycerate kinase type-2 family protein n=1 Tax=Tabrizicola sp. TaxID=2005166 RepID=UPI002AB89161|nr:glycerate kinase [Tabrizicola sp.]MDZ4086445.1 glycerate kinase [Tabrizicola sp.]
MIPKSNIPDPARFLRSLFDRAVEVADPMRSLAGFLPEKPKGRVLVIGAGKASARMAEAVEAAWGPCDGLVITRYGYGRPCQGIEIIEAAHPVPDQAGVDATQRILQLLDGLTEDDFVLALVSGGASALLCGPAQGMTLAEKQQVNAALLASGAPIVAMNTVRKHLSQVKGGQLSAASYPARLLALMISDVPGDDPAFIGSGPTVGDATTPDDVRAILDRWAIPVPPSARAVLDHSGVVPPGDPRLSRTENVIYAAPAQSLAAAADLAAPLADVRTLGDRIEGEARDVARDQAAMARDIAASLKSGDRPVLLLSGGELTVTRTGDGVGGPNAEFCLALALALNGHPQIYALACDTDGVDGAAEVAGALVSPRTLQTPGAAEALARNDAHSWFAKVGSQVVTGPTLTNVNDFRAILILPPE